MKVLHVNTERTWRGGERQIELLLRHGRPDIESFVACPSKGELSKKLREDYQVIDFSITHSFDLAGARRLKNICRANRIEIVHCHTPRTLTIAVMSKILGNRVPIISTKRTSFAIGNNPLSRFKYRQADRIVCVSKASRDLLIDQLPDLVVEVIPSAIEKTRVDEDSPIDRQYPDLASHRKVGYVAALTSEKNFQTFLATAAQILRKHTDISFLWIGDGKLRQEIVSRTQSMRLSDRILFPGFQDEIHNWMADLDVLFFPSRKEGYPTTILDAMQLSVPVVASDIPGIKEIIVHEETGLLCPPDDPEAFSHAIERVLDDSMLQSRLISAAKRSLAGKYAEDMALAYHELYEDLIYEKEEN